ncbi:class I SAM-dependent methyltransferase [Nocardiopsis algeriensis]|uniref:Putative O-methyltransferase YrrM n=1 Tax=Nocardiopsis algeriensis TaxID=1478215 RepID=A0A841IMM0_9ACTN|nr:class I SAM-dependent methyltransferase [Nocardiopsis algeriensis]MBB6119903.1 putative O-methyltransferase YrrM [Nocardiopsis algeriensis]
MPAPAITLDHITTLYRTHSDDLTRVREHMRHHHNPDHTPQLDDIEAEITYLLLRHHTPRNVVQIGTHQGWATTWILHALHDNGTGHLHTFDTTDHAAAHVPPHLARDRWTHTQGDVRAKAARIPADTDYLFIDATRNGWFARWYLHHLLPALPPHIPVSVHDVFHQRYALPFTEGALLLTWLTNNTTSYFTASAARAPHTHQALRRTRALLGMDTPIHPGHHNPMVFFHLPERPRPGHPTRPPARSTPVHG